MANSIGWGQGNLNNLIGWGLGAVNNLISWGLYHKEENSWSGETEIYGLTALQSQFKTRVEADGGIIENLKCIKI
jgi:hypothetical protein